MNQTTKTTTFSNGLIWFGAAMSIAEILTGTFIAPLGFQRGILAIVLGHAIGCVLLYFAGLIGAKTGKSAMETVKTSFGDKGSLIFSSLNVLQLVGWTAVMIVSGGAAASTIVKLGGDWVWSIIIGALIIVWILIGIKNLNKINVFAMGALFVLTIILSSVVFKGTSLGELFQGFFEMKGLNSGEGISFGAAVELSVAMPLSWLPLISDYTRTAQNPKNATLVSVSVYFIVSCWMYIIGMGASIFTGQSDISQIMMSSGLGIAALIIVVFSTVTTTFLDAYSAGVSTESISKNVKEKSSAIVVCLMGTALAIFTPITQYEGFLYLIGSVFAPMIAVLIVSFFILKVDYSKKNCAYVNLIVWVIGFVIYRLFMQIDTVIGNTLPVMIITAGICIVANKVLETSNIIQVEKN